MNESWSTDSWRRKPVSQIPKYEDETALENVLARLSRLPPLVTSWEVETLKSQLAEVARGERFLLQGGDCSESFDECEPEVIAGKLKILLQMSLVLVHGMGKRVIRVGRFAGQYAKPRSSDDETRGGVTHPSYRGDLVNSPGFTGEERRPNPELLLRGYERSASTLNFIRSLVAGGFADLHHPEYWDLGFVVHSPQADEYHKMTRAIGEAIRFMEAVSGANVAEMSRVDFFTSHEGLHLYYEEAQTRRVPRRTGWYDLSTHFPWIGDRTRGLGGAHVEFFRGIENPIGVKVGPSMAPAELVELARILDPKSTPGRLTLIHRFGAARIGDSLPPLLEAIERAGRQVVWCCDPMHGNTESKGAYKTRSFENILSELEQAFEIHSRKGTYLGGVHFELTGDNVTECTGGARGLKAEDLGKAYKSQVDPRLNYEQALEMAILIARRVQGR
jgi:3-deoxy-7-phosphoheptulonate synthase